MNTILVKSFYLIGIALQTHFDHEGSDIQKHWEAFYAHNIYAQIPDKIDHGIYAVYCDYENGFREHYTMVIGCKVSSLEHIPQGMVGITIPEQTYNIYQAKGPMPQTIMSTWQSIRNSTEISRNFKADFEYYCPAFLQAPTENPVEIYIGIKK